MRSVILLTPALLLSLACQWNQAPRLSVETNASQVDVYAAPEPASTTFTTADFARHVAQLNKRLPSIEFTIVVQSPFVVVGDE